MEAVVIETKLLEKLVERAVAARMAEMRGALWVHNQLLCRLAQQLSKETAQQVALATDEAWLALPEPEREVARASMDQWRKYLAQRGGLVEGETPPLFPPGEPARQLGLPGPGR